MSKPNPAVDRARSIFADLRCHCARSKSRSSLLCQVCMGKIPPKLANDLDEVEWAEALMALYDQALLGIAEKRA